MEVTQILQQAVDHLVDQRMDKAMELCELVLSAEPDNDEALLLTGGMYAAIGQGERAIGCYQRVAQLTPQTLNGCVGDAMAHKLLGNTEEAVSIFRKAIARFPEDRRLWSLLGDVYRGTGRTAEAEQCYRQMAAEQSPSRRPQGKAPTARQSSSAPKRSSARELCQRAAETHRTGNFSRAYDLFQQAVQSDARSAEAWVGMGTALVELKRLAEATVCFEKAIAFSPDHVYSLTRLTQLLLECRQGERAERYARKLIALRPHEANGHALLGNALLARREMGEAEAALRHALTFRGDHAWTYLGLGFSAGITGAWDEAIRYNEQALQLRPNFPQAQFNLGLLRLLYGDFEQGWKLYEARDDGNVFAGQMLQCPRWDGSPLEGRTVLVYPEQGLGDTIQFARYLPLIRQAGGRVRFVCPEPLYRLFQGLEGVETMTMEETRLPQPNDCDVHIRLLSLPYVFRTRVETIPASIPYLVPDPERREIWRDRLASAEGLKVGIVWAGAAGFMQDRDRSSGLAAFAPLAQLPGVAWFSLQKGEQAVQQLEKTPAGMRIVDLQEHLTDFAETAAAIANLDLVITVDTSVAHVAGAIGAPVWTLLSSNNDFRWMRERSDSPWYPTMRLFRQPRLGDWQAVFAEVSSALSERLTHENRAPFR